MEYAPNRSVQPHGHEDDGCGDSQAGRGGAGEDRRTAAEPGDAPDERVGSPARTRGRWLVCPDAMPEIRRSESRNGEHERREHVSGLSAPTR